MLAEEILWGQLSHNALNSTIYKFLKMVLIFRAGDSEVCEALDSGVIFKSRGPKPLESNAC